MFLGVSRSVIQVRTARNLLAAQACQGAAGWMQTTAGGWLAISLTDSASAVALFAFVSMSPSIVCTPIGGRLIDTHDPRRLAVTLGFLAALPPLLIGSLQLAGSITYPILLLLTLISSIPRSLQSPLFPHTISEYVPVEIRDRALAISGALFNISKVIAPVIAGLLGPGCAFLGSSFLFIFVASTMVLTHLDPAQQRVDTRKAKRPRKSWKSDLAAIRREPLVRAVFTAAVIFYFISGSIHQLLAVIAADTSSTSSALGYLFGAAALGAVSVNRMAVRRLAHNPDRVRPIALSLFGSVIASVLLSLSTSFAADIALMFLLGGVGEIIWLTSQKALLLDAGKSNSGEIFGVFLGIIALSTVLGSIVLGGLMDLAGTRSALLFIGIAGMMVVFVWIRTQAVVSSK